MSDSIIHPHIYEGRYRGPVLISLVGHVFLFLFFLYAVELFPQGEPVEIGTGLGGGQSGDFVTVGLSSENSGGAGMYKPSLTPRAAAVPVAPQEKTEQEVTPPASEQDVFVEKGQRPESGRTTTSKAKAASPAPAGAIPRAPDPGSGGAGGRSAGSGGGFGGGQGVTIGSGTGEGVFDSWYARQVEQRIGQNWLKTSLGSVPRPVQTIVSFEIRANGKIENVEIQEFSGLGSVDLAAQRAILASSPLPPLPYEFRQRTVKFIAYFEYPPR